VIVFHVFSNTEYREQRWALRTALDAYAETIELQIRHRMAGLSVCANARVEVDPGLPRALMGSVAEAGHRSPIFLTNCSLANVCNFLVTLAVGGVHQAEVSRVEQRFVRKIEERTFFSDVSPSSTIPPEAYRRSAVLRSYPRSTLNQHSPSTWTIFDSATLP